jgi:hypothetical protein
MSAALFGEVYARDGGMPMMVAPLVGGARGVPGEVNTLEVGLSGRDWGEAERARVAAEAAGSAGGLGGAGDAVSAKPSALSTWAAMSRPVVGVRPATVARPRDGVAVEVPAADVEVEVFEADAGPLARLESWLGRYGPVGRHVGLSNGQVIGVGVGLGVLVALVVADRRKAGR